MSEADIDQSYSDAMAILSNQRRFGEWKAAIEAVDRAADQGLAQAEERRALLECRGSYREASWDSALDWLVSAAKHGSEQAARQLILLADDVYEPRQAVGDADFDSVRQRIAIERRSRPPVNAGNTLSGEPLVHAIRAMASPAECRWLIHCASNRLAQAEVYGRDGETDKGRTNRSARLDFVNSNLIVELLRQRIANEIGAPSSFFEVAQVLAYRVGEEFVLHRDALHPVAFSQDIARYGQRPATVLVYLNEDFEGGETSFPELGIEHRGKTGDALIFANLDRFGQPEPRSTHAGRPPTSGEKWVFSQWVRDRQLG